MAQRVKSGLELLRNGKRCYVGQLRLVHDKLEINSDDGDLAILTPDALRREIVDGYTQLLAPDSHGVLQPVLPGWKENESKKSQEHRHKISQTLQFVDNRQKEGVLWKDMTREVASFYKELKLEDPPTERTLRNWRCKDKGHESAVSPKWHLCGNRFQGPDEVLLGAIRDVVDIAVINTDRFTLTAAWGTIEAKYDEQWRKQYGDESRPPQRGMRNLKNFMRAMPWNEVMKLRMDGRTARAMTRVAVHNHKSDVLWDCVEMDATVLDILICDENGVEIGRPVLYVAVDVASGYVVGLYLTIQKPSTLSFVECLRFMFFPKPEGFDKRYGIKNRIEVFGKPILARVDNGSEFIGNAAEELVYYLFGDMVRCRPYTPQEKPHVERFNGTLKAYIVTLRGATTSSVNGGKRTPPPEEKLYQIEELRGLIFRFVYDRYSLLSNELRSMVYKKAVAPYDLIIAMKKTYTEPVPVSRAEFERSLSFKRDKRSLGHDGIGFDGWMYHSDELARLYLTVGPGQYEFLYSDLDATLIHVISPSTGELVPAYEKTHEGSSVDRITAKAIKKRIRLEGTELDRRAFEHKLVDFRALEETAKTSRGRAQQARISDRLDAAEEHVRQTMPKLKVNSSNKTVVSICEELLHEDNAPRGRKMGEGR